MSAITRLASAWSSHSSDGLSPLDERTAEEWAAAFSAVSFFRHHETFQYDGDGLVLSRRVMIKRDAAPQSITLYRCASPGRERGMAWADSADYASHFGPRTFGYHSFEPKIYGARVPRAAVYAILTSSTRDGGRVAEYVIDTRGLRITTLTDLDAAPQAFDNGKEGSIGRISSMKLVGPPSAWAEITHNHTKAGK